MNAERWRESLRGCRFPLASLNLDAFHDNLSLLRADFQRAGKSLRLCTKSLRCGPLIGEVVAEPFVVGVMAYSPYEAPFLATRYGVQDILLGYPIGDEGDAEPLCRAAALPGVQVTVMADSLHHLDLLERAAAAHNVRLGVLVDLNVAYIPLPGIHLGVRRSPLRTPQQVCQIAAAAAEKPHLEFRGLMGYEAQNAATPDRPHERLIKRLSQGAVRAQRRQVVEALTRMGLPPQVVNGGGSGCYGPALADPVITEVGVGSALYKPHLFDGFDSLRPFQPALAFALQVVRLPAPGIVTCFGGGYVSSGVAQPPIPFFPPGLTPLSLEGFGEVQTPLRYDPRRLRLEIGDPILCRPAKAGEPLERFDMLYLVEGGRLIGSYPTYRGEGLCLG